MSNHLAGPWLAVLADRDGFVYDSFADAVEQLGEEHDEEMTVSVVRGTAMPSEKLDGDDIPRMTGSYSCGDVAHTFDDVWLVDPDDATIGAEARLTQAQAMAAGLNAAGGQ